MLTFTSIKSMWVFSNANELYRRTKYYTETDISAIGISTNNCENNFNLMKSFVIIRT